MAIFPSEAWVNDLKVKLNTDEKYAQIARNWEGDMVVEIEKGGNLNDTIIYYLDLWHGKCREAYEVPYENYVRLLKGEIEPMQGLLTRKISVQGNMAILMRNVPTVLDFVRCAREITYEYI
jgi:putative sterol carrier protein